MKNTLKHIAFLVVFAVGFFSCKKDDDPTKAVLGKWKLEKVKKFPTHVWWEDVGVLETFDYSQYNIVYEFKAKNVLTVSGACDIDNYKGHETGNHFFKIHKPVTCRLCKPGPDMFEINDARYRYRLFERTLELRGQPQRAMEGENVDFFFAYYFTKID
jgi:hypothetical protein